MEEMNSGEEMEAAAPESNESMVDETQAQEDSKVVPLEALEDERHKRQELAGQVELLKNHMNLLAAGQQKPQAEQTLSEDDDDILTVGQARKGMAKIEQDFQSRVSELEFASKHPDYNEVIQKYLPEALKEEPYWSTVLTPSSFAQAYSLAKKSEAYKKDHGKRKRNADAEKMVANSQRSGSLSSVGGAASGNGQPDWLNMPKAEFDRRRFENVYS